MEDANKQKSTESDTFSMDELHLIEVIIKNPFVSDVKLAELTGLHRTTIAKIKDRSHVKDKIKDYVVSNIERFQQIQEKALNFAEKIIDSEDESVTNFMKWQAAKPFVDSLKTTKLEVESDAGQIPVFNLVPIKPQ